MGLLETSPLLRLPLNGGAISPLANGLQPVLSADALLTSTRLRLLDAGYLPVPANGKKPGIARYPAYATAPPSEIAVSRWTRIRPGCRNTGIVCGFTRVIDLDVDDPSRAARCREIIASVLAEYERLPCRIGRWPRVMLFARSDDPNRSTSRSKFKNGAIEFLGRGAHAVVDGTHPDTGRPYYWWPDTALWEECADKLPILTAAQEATILERIGPLLGGRMTMASSSAAPPAPASGSKISVGWRHIELFPKIKEKALICSTLDELSAYAKALNGSLCAVELDRVEIDRIVQWTWDRKVKGELWPRGGEARAVVTRSEWSVLDPDANHLLTGLRLHHAADPAKQFAVASRAMAASFKMGPPRITRARDRLIALGLLEQMGPKGRRNHPTQYRLRAKSSPAESSTSQDDPL